MRKADTRMSKDIDNLDMVARAAGFAMAGSEENFNQPPVVATEQRADGAGAATETASAQARTWLRQVATLKPHFPAASGWSPWKATA